MRRRRRAAAIVAGAASALAGAAGCGTPSADLFVVQRTGAIPGARLSLRLIDDGSVSCNRGAPREITSAQLIEARAIERDLAKPAKAGVRVPPGPGSILTYGVRTEDGSVRFSDTSRGQPPVFFRTAAFVREIARGSCGLPR
jgi:hypothetical protein